MNAAAQHESAPVSAPAPDLLVGWSAIASALEVPVETAMRWRLALRLPVEVERRDNARRSAYRVTARREDVLAWRETTAEAVPPLPRLAARRRLFPDFRERWPSLADWQPPDIVTRISPRNREGKAHSFRFRWKNMTQHAPAFSHRQRSVAASWSDAAMPLPDGGWGLAGMSVHWLAVSKFDVCDRTVQREADELAPALRTETRFRKTAPTARPRPRDQLANDYLMVISCEVLEALGYPLTPALCRAIADLDPSAEARARALEAPLPSERPPPRPRATEAPKPPQRTPAPPQPAKGPPAAPAPELDELALALAREPSLTGQVKPRDLESIDNLRRNAEPPRSLAQALIAIWRAFDHGDQGPALLDRIKRYVPAERPVTDAQVVRGFMLHSSALKAAAEDPFPVRVAALARDAGRPLLGVEGVLEALRETERAGLVDVVAIQADILERLGVSPASSSTSSSPAPEAPEAPPPSAAEVSARARAVLTGLGVTGPP